MDTSAELLRLTQELAKRSKENAAAKFKPWQKQADFLNTTADITAFIAGNRCGKSMTASYMMACHLTGNYPSWWKGLRFAGPITLWACGITWIRLRDTIQTMLLGQLGRMGTGMIPKDCIGEVIKKSGIPYAVDQVQIKHASGEWSRLQFFSYEMSREQFQGSSVNLAWFDEEPPQDIFDEVKMRILDCGGNIVFTFTPLSGCTPLYDDLMKNHKVYKVHMSMDEAGHLDKEKVDELLDGMDEYQKQARRFGIASVGSGKVFQFLENDYTIEPFDIPTHWKRLGGLDVGLTHPTGAVCVVEDPDSSTYYVVNEYKVSNKTPIDHCAHLKPWSIKFATDPSAFHRQIGTMTSVAQMYEDEGLELVKANNDVDQSIMLIRKLIGSGRLYIFTTLQMLLKEMRTYRTNDSGKIIKVDDDLIDPLRYAIMGIEEHGEVMKRHRVYHQPKQFKPADPKVGY